MKVKVLGVCASPVKGGNVETLLQTALDFAAEEKDVEVQEMIKLAGLNIQDCIHCNWCLVKQKEGEFCVQKDDMQQFYPRIIAADVMFYATPVYHMRPATSIQAFQDRLRCLAEGRHQRFALEGAMMDKVVAGMTVGYMRHAGIETALLALIESFMLLGSNVIVSGGLAEPLGVAGLSSPKGRGEFDPSDKLTAANEDFAKVHAYILAKRAVGLAKVLKAGKEAVPKEEWFKWRDALRAFMTGYMPWQAKTAK